VTVTRAPRFDRLTDDECADVLRRNHVGRIAFVSNHVVDIEPVHFVASDSWLLMRSAHGAKLEAFAHSPYVAFEVDEVDGPFDWRSVVVHGTIYLMAKHAGRFNREAYERALDTLRAVAPETLTEDDPTPFRDTIYGLHIDGISGRSARSR
jgi:nitroimidazol reductase NimA-like FMN-containing flavoprotein (pyridoxamine 5'-phosphate oxidase superfamily)